MCLHEPAGERSSRSSRVGKCGVRSPCCLEEIGNALCGFRLAVSKRAAAGQPCPIPCPITSLVPAPFPNASPWPWPGIFITAPSHVFCSGSRLPLEVPAGAVVFHVTIVSLTFSRHLSHHLHLLFRHLPPLCLSVGFLHLFLLGDLSPAPQTPPAAGWAGPGGSAVKQHQDVNKNKHREKCQTW